MILCPIYAASLDYLAVLIFVCINHRNLKGSIAFELFCLLS